MGPRLSSQRPRLSLAVVVCSTLTPLVGVFALGWETVPVLVFYWLEFGVVVGWTCVEMLFAHERPAERVADRPLSELTDKRGGKALWTGGPPAYPRNVPHALGVLGGFGLLWSGLGVGIASSDSLSTLPVGSLVLGAVGVAVGRGIEFRDEFVGHEEYRDVSARMVAATPARQLLAVLLLGLFVSAIESTHAQGRIAITLVVTGKVAFELYSYREHHVENRGGRFDRALDAVFGTRDTALPRDPVQVPEGEPTETVEVDERTVLIRSVVSGLLVVALQFYVVAVLVGGVVFAAIVWGVWGLLVSGTVVLAVLLTALVAATASHYLLGGWVEYQRYDGVLVAYDRLLDEAQWRLDLSSITDVSVARSVTNRFVVAGALRLKAQNRNGDQRVVSVGPFTDLDVAATSLGLARYDTPPDPDRAVAAAAIGIFGMFFLPFVAMYASGELSLAGTILLSVVMAPMLVMVLGPLLYTALLNW